MNKEIVEKRNVYDLFYEMDSYFEEHRKRMEKIREQMNSVFSENIENINVIKMGNIEDFKKSVDEFQKKNPNAKISARAYTFSTNNPEQNKIFEFSNEQEKLPEKKQKKAQKKVTKKK